MHKRITACILAIILLLGVLVSCNKDDGVPDGMYSATVAGEPFTLYVPEGWTDNRDSGISSAYYSLVDAVTVSAKYYTMQGEETLEAYMAKCEAAYSGYAGYKIKERAASLLGGKDAVRYEFSFLRTVDTAAGSAETRVGVIQYYVQNGSQVVMLNFYCIESALDDTYREMFEQIRKEFVLGESVPVDENPVTDKKTPEGMKIASHSESEYVFYVPMSWSTDMSDKMSEAHVPASGKPNISVTSFSPDGQVTAAEYFSQCEAIYKKDISSYTRIGDSARTVGGCEAISYIYTAAYGSASYKIMQTVLIYNSMAYSITYTALSEDFDIYLSDVNTMLDSFRFR